MSLRWLIFALIVLSVAMASGEPTLAAATNALPPGASLDDSGPSDVVFPAQQLTIKFDHKKHVAMGRTCVSCHASATTSASVADKLTPAGTTCDGCHLTDHRDLAAVKPGDDATGQCAFCHEGYKEGDGNAVAKFVIPRANMVFSHGKHSARNIGCPQCHGAVQELGQATRDQMPRMRGCFGCHQKPDSASRGDAKGACDTCHIKGSGSEAGQLKTMFAAGDPQASRVAPRRRARARFPRAP